MKILIVNESLKLGGAVAFSIELANGFVRQGDHEVAFCSGGGVLQSRLDRNVCHFVLPNFSWLRCATIMQQAQRVLRDFKPNIIHAHGATISWLFQRAKKRWKGRVPLLLTHHSGVVRRGIRMLDRFLFRQTADHFIAITQNKRNSLLRLGIPDSKITLIPNGVDVQRLQDQAERAAIESTRKELIIPPDAIVVMMAGRLVQGKRFDLFMEVIRRAHQKDHRICGVIVGDGPLREELTHCAPKCIRFAGFTGEIERILAIADIVVSTSTSSEEVMPMVLLEAGAVGKPVICSDIPAHRNLIHNGMTGVLVPGNDVEKYVELVVRFARDEKLRRGYGNAWETQIRRQYNIDIIVKQHEMLYQKLLATYVK